MPGGTTTPPTSPGLYWIDRTNTVLKVVQKPGGQLAWQRVVEPVYYRCETIQWSAADINQIESELINAVILDMHPVASDNPDPCSEYPSQGRPQVFDNDSVSLHHGIHAVGIIGTRIFDSSNPEVAGNLMFVPPQSDRYMLNSDFTLLITSNSTQWTDANISLASNVEGIGNRALTITANFRCKVYPYEDTRMMDVTQLNVNIIQGV